MAELTERERLEFRYRLERELADRIRRAPPAERTAVTLAAYDELFRRVTWHPGRLESERGRAADVASYAAVDRFLGEGGDLLDIGCGRAAHLRRIAPRQRRCVGVDVSPEILAQEAPLPPNVELVVADAVDLAPLPDAAFDVACSTQLIEHLHPEDAPRHLRAVARVLRPGGRYVFETPSRLSGPHDVSKHFDRVATGFHLREYTYGELLPLLRAAGFRAARAPLFRDRLYRRAPWLARPTVWPAAWRLPGEALAALVPPGPARRAAVAALRLNIIVIARR